MNVKEREDKSLNGFCSHIRYARNNPEKSSVVLTDDRIASLDALGFEWTVRKQSFEQRIAEIQAYNEKHGHIHVKKRENKSLYKFCFEMRRARNNPGTSSYIMNDDRIASLDALGFEWSLDSGIKSFAQQTDQLPSKKRKQKGQGKVDTATKKKHVSHNARPRMIKVVPLLHSVFAMNPNS